MPSSELQKWQPIGARSRSIWCPRGAPRHRSEVESPNTKTWCHRRNIPSTRPNHHWGQAQPRRQVNRKFQTRRQVHSPEPPTCMKGLHNERGMPHSSSTIIPEDTEGLGQTEWHFRTRKLRKMGEDIASTKMKWTRSGQQTPHCWSIKTGWIAAWSRWRSISWPGDCDRNSPRGWHKNPDRKMKVK